MIASVANTITPCIVGRSRLRTLFSARRPSPGRLKIASVKIAPPSAMPMSRPSIVTTGSSALRRTCRRTTTFSGAPFARAVRT